MVAVSDGEMLAAAKKVRKAEHALLVENAEFTLTFSDPFASVLTTGEKRVKLKSALIAYKEAREAFEKLIAPQ